MFRWDRNSVLSGARRAARQPLVQAGGVVALVLIGGLAVMAAPEERDLMATAGQETVAPSSDVSTTTTIATIATAPPEPAPAELVPPEPTTTTTVPPSSPPTTESPSVVPPKAAPAAPSKAATPPKATAPKAATPPKATPPKAATPPTTTTTVAPPPPAPTPPTTVAPPTTTTTARPPVGGVAFGWQLTVGNTGLAGAGVDRNSLPVFNGPITAGMTLSKVKITRGVDLSNVPNVTLDRVLIQPSGANRALILGPGTVIKDSDIDGISMPNGERWGISSGTGSGTTGNYTIQRVQITHVSIGMWLDSANSSSTGTVSETYVHDLISTNGAHLDGFTRRGGTGPVTILRSRIAVDYSDGGGSHATGAVFLQNTWGGQIGGVTIQDTYLEGNGFNMVLENKGAGTSLAVSNVRVRPTEHGAVSNSGVNFTQWANVYSYSPTAPNNAGNPIPRP